MIINDKDLTNFKYNRVGGIDADYTKDGEVLPYTLTADEVALVEGDIAAFDSNSYEEIKAINAFKAGREVAISSLTVTTSGGNIYQADAVSTAKMGTRVIALLGEDDTFLTEWSLADTATGVMTDVTYADLKEALRLATDDVTGIWGV